ncbi:MAG: hypothetical protein PHQ40_17230, partial [Anaerolineaceae bacterium]|nr:hypothetical protein [Anaerolineaceae bacterium]
MNIPKQINLGSGKDFRDAFFNIDANPATNPDWRYDICKPIAWDHEFHSPRFGDFYIEKETFDLIIANDVLEHLPDLVTAMTNCLDLLH